MNLGLLRTAKIIGLLIAATAIVLLSEMLFSIGMLVSGDPADSQLRTVEREGNTSAVIAEASAPGYRSRIDVAVTVAFDGEILSERVVAHSESAYVRSALDRGGADALSGASFTEEGIRAATKLALAAAREYIEEQR